MPASQHETRSIEELSELLEDQKSRNKALNAVNEDQRQQMDVLRQRNRFLEQDVGDDNARLHSELREAAKGNADLVRKPEDHRWDKRTLRKENQALKKELEECRRVIQELRERYGLLEGEERNEGDARSGNGDKAE